MTSEINRMSFEPTRNSVDCSMSLDKKIIGYKTQTISEAIYEEEEELFKKMTTETCYEPTNTNPNRIYILVNICLKLYNRNNFF